MVYRLECDCEKRVGIKVDSIKLFKQLVDFFSEQLKNGIFEEDLNKEPYYTWTDGAETVSYTAAKWYRCKACGCLWEFNYPDFPAPGFVRKYPDGIYNGLESVAFKEHKCKL